MLFFQPMAVQCTCVNELHGKEWQSSGCAPERVVQRTLNCTGVKGALAFSISNSAVLL